MNKRFVMLPGLQGKQWCREPSRCRVMHKIVLKEISDNLFDAATLTLQVFDFKAEIFCLLNGHFVETRINAGLLAVKGGLSTKLSTANVDIPKTPYKTAT